MPVLKEFRNGVWVEKGSDFPYVVGGLAPTGTVTIQENGVTNVADFKFADVKVPVYKPVTTESVTAFVLAPISATTTIDTIEISEVVIASATATIR